MRQSFIPPIPELRLAVKLLDAACDALLLGDCNLAAQLIRDADIPTIFTYTVKIVGPLTEEIHRQTKLPEVLPKSERNEARIPGAAVQRAIFQRDGWHCRFCGIGVISREARSLLIKLFPDETHWTTSEYDRHSALYALAVSLDHIIPHSRGGTNESENLVTTCFCCQFGRGHYTLEETQLMDPRDRLPVITQRDGLTRINGLSTRSI